MHFCEPLAICVCFHNKCLNLFIWIFCVSSVPKNSFIPPLAEYVSMKSSNHSSICFDYYLESRSDVKWSLRIVWGNQVSVVLLALPLSVCPQITNHCIPLLSSHNIFSWNSQVSCSIYHSITDFLKKKRRSIFDILHASNVLVIVDH